MLIIPGYKIENSPIASGTIVTYRGTRDSDGAAVFAKMPAGGTPDPRARERLERERDTLQRLDGVRGVPRCLAYERIQDRPVLVLEATEGHLLSEIVGTPLPISRFLDIAIRLAGLVAGVHARGVIHKEIRPATILVDRADHVSFVDFGCATVQSVEHVGATAATLRLPEAMLAYMSPEQTGRMNRAVDERTDLYSLGVVLYELLTGQLPFRGKDALEWFHVHMARLATPPSDVLPDVPAPVSAIVVKLLAKVAEERYQSAAGVTADLERCRSERQRGALATFALGAADVPLRFQVPQKLYGREADSAALRAAFDRVANRGKPELVLVSGYSGIGKSAVVQELHRPVVERRGFFLSGKFDQMQRDVPYATIAQAIRGLVQQVLAGTNEEIAAYRERLRAACEDGVQLIVDIAPQLELVVGKQPPAPDLPPAEAQNRFHRAFQAFLRVFASREHPLVIFLDDLQWTDLASLRLLEHLVTHPDTPPLLLIGAYRDNEVSRSHALALTVEEIRKKTAVHEIRLAPLTGEHTRAFVADALQGTAEGVVHPLADVVYQKTGGNPFFLIQFLVTLNKDGLLRRGSGGAYEWSADAVAAKAYSENVVDIIVGRLRQLPEKTQHLLRLAACAGNTFSLETLSIIADDAVVSVDAALEAALVEGMIARSEHGEYHFLHDRIQQAAYALIPEAERKAVHLRIGRLLLAKLSPEQMQDRLFEVVHQLNAGSELMQDADERRRVARLNAEAGHKARAANAYRSAIAYFDATLANLPGDPWEAEYDLVFKVQLGRARCESMVGRPEEARRLADDLFSRGKSNADKCAAARVKCEVLVAASENAAAVSCILDAVALYGVKMSPHPSWDEVAAANEEVWNLLAGRDIESLLTLPPISDANVREILDTLATLFSPAYFTDGNLLILHLCRMVALSIRHGNSEAAAHGYVWYGVVAGPVFKKYREAYALGKLACDLVEKNKYTGSRGKVLYSMEIINYWTKPISISLDLIRNAFHYCAQAGDFQIACYACNHIVTNRISLGHPLEEVFQESITRMEFARNVGFRDVVDIIRPAQRYVQGLRGLGRAFGSLDGDGFDEAKFEADLTPDRMITMICWYHVVKMQARYMAGDMEGALAASREAESRIWASLAHIQLLDHHLFRPLTLAANFARVGEEERKTFLEAMSAHRQQLEEWASHCPENFRCCERMVAGEIARVSGRPEEALQAFEAAIASARENGFVQHVALANELAARLYRQQGLATAAAAHAREAREGYRRWGADGKVRALDAEWRPAEQPGATVNEKLEALVSNVDTLAVVKAQQAISGEIVLEQLASTLLRVAIESAGARRGALLLSRGDDLALEVAFDASKGGAVTTTNEDVAHDFFWATVAYVKRTREAVVIDDASKPNAFGAAAAAGSVVCLPLQRRSELRGVLYLENDVATYAFTPDRTAILEHIASQAAISIENARLYGELKRAETKLRSANDELERRVDERTRELRQAQARLVETARTAGMAEVASSVLHNVGNVLNSIGVHTSVIGGLAQSSRVERLGQVAGLLRDRNGDLADFLTNDARGRRLPEFIDALSEELRAEQAQIAESVSLLDQHVEHVRAIIQVQQGYARAPMYAEEIDVVRVVADTVRMQAAALERHGITVEQDLEDVVATAHIDKHKVLQILINLISNAKYAMDSTPEGERKLVVRVRANDGMASIQIIDNGVGIAPEHLDRVFSHGFSMRKDGHGFGLHSSALAAKLLGGSLTLESTGLGKGATATLTFPLRRRASMTPTRPSAPPPPN